MQTVDVAASREARGMEIERLDRQLGGMTQLALDAVMGLEAARVQLAGEARQSLELGEVLDGAVADVVTARARERELAERCARLERALASAQDRAADAASELQAFEAGVADLLEAWDLSTPEVTDRVRGAVRALRILGRGGR